MFLEFISFVSWFDPLMKFARSASMSRAACVLIICNALGSFIADVPSQQIRSQPSPSCRLPCKEALKFTAHLCADFVKYCLYSRARLYRFDCLKVLSEVTFLFWLYRLPNAQSHASASKLPCSSFCRTQKFELWARGCISRWATYLIVHRLWLLCCTSIACSHHHSISLHTDKYFDSRVLFRKNWNLPLTLHWTVCSDCALDAKRSRWQRIDPGSRKNEFFFQALFLSKGNECLNSPSVVSGC